MVESNKELENELIEAANAILFPPPPVTELLPLLDRVESSLTKVEQSPSESMKKALTPSMKVMIADDLLRHSDIDIKVAVASCISEITRITAPDAPYEDDRMKEVFQLIVSSFERLDDKSSPSYNKRASILETVAKVRSCVLMLDLECDALIAEMFQNFFRSLRDYHPENVFSSMETIMTLVLEESEDIPLGLVSSILDCLKTENKEVLPVTRQLAEKVIKKCACKLKPFLLRAVGSHASLDGYNKVVANVCQTGSEAVEPADKDTASKNVAGETDVANVPPEKAVEVAMETLDDASPNEEVGPSSVGSLKLGNGTLQKEIEDSSAGNNLSKEAEDGNDQDKTDVEPNKNDAESLGAEELAKCQSKPERSNKRKGKKTNALKSASNFSVPSRMDNIKEAIMAPECQEKNCEVDGAKTEDRVTDDAGPAENNKESDENNESDAPVSLAKTSEDVSADVPAPVCTGSPADESRSKKVGGGKKKDDSMLESEPTVDVDSMKESIAKNMFEGTIVSEKRSHKRPVKKLSLVPDREDETRSSVNESKKEDEDTIELNAKVAKQSGKKVEVLGCQREDKKSREQVKGTSVKGLAKTPSKDVKKNPSLKSTGKSTKDGSDVGKASKASSKRDRSPEEERLLKRKNYGSELVGSKVKVWWPDDDLFYEGVVKSFNPVRRKHKVVYTDGDVEVLNLAIERWEMIEDNSADQEISSDGESPDELSEAPKRKKAKTSMNLGDKQGKTKSLAKKGGASSSKSKTTPKSGRKHKDDSNVDGKYEEEDSKSVGKSDEEKDGKFKDKKAGNKSSKGDVANTSKGSNKSKQDMLKGAAKTKGKSPKSGGKSITSSSGKVKAGSSSRDEEDAENSTEPAKTAKSPKSSKSQKSAKKRKRGA